SPVCGAFVYGRYWARTSDPQLVDSEQCSDGFGGDRSERMVERNSPGSERLSERERTSNVAIVATLTDDSRLPPNFASILGRAHGKERVDGSSPGLPGKQHRARSDPAQMLQEVAGNPRPRPVIPARQRKKSPALFRKSPHSPGRPRKGVSGLSGRRSRVRVPSLPSFKHRFSSSFHPRSRRRAQDDSFGRTATTRPSRQSGLGQQDFGLLSVPGERHRLEALQRLPDQPGLVAGDAECAERERF